MSDVRKEMEAVGDVVDVNPPEDDPMSEVVPNGQKGRRFRRVQVTLDQESRERYDRIRASVPELESLSAAIRYAGRITEAALAKRIE